MAVITIDGIKLDVPENKNVLDCALEMEFTSHILCHTRLKPTGLLSYVCGRSGRTGGSNDFLYIEGKRRNGDQNKDSGAGASENAGSGAASDRTSGRLFYMSEVRKL